MAKTLQTNIAAVRRFNREVLENGNENALAELLDAAFVNRTAMPGLDTGIDGMRHLILEVLHKGLTDIRVEILDQVADGDTVATRKRIVGTHSRDFLGAAATGRAIEITVYDFVRLRAGKYIEHWGLNTIAQVARELRDVAASE